MKRKLFVVLCLALCLAFGTVAFACGGSKNSGTDNPPPNPPVEETEKIEIGGVKNGIEYELGKDEVKPTFNKGTATLAKNGGVGAPFTSGTQITEVGDYVLTVTYNETEKKISFKVVHPAPVISGVVNHSVYYAGIDKVAPTFDRGTATLSKDDGLAEDYIGGTEITETGKYTLTVEYEDRTTEYVFWIKEYQWTPGEGEYKLIDDFSEDNWTHQEKGTKTVEGGAMTLEIDDGLIKAFRDINVRTTNYSIIQFTLSEVNLNWDRNFGISVSNRTVGGWPTVSANGTNMNRVFKDGKWHVYLDLNDAVGGDGAATLVNKLSVTVHIETYIEGANKSVVFDDISFVTEIPQGAQVTGVENNGKYTLGVDTVKPVFTEGTATLSRNGGAAQAFVSGTEITERGNYVLTVSHNGIDSVVSFSVVEPLPGSNNITTIDDFGLADWSKVDDDGSMTFDGGKMTVTSSGPVITVYRDIELCTTKYSLVEFVFDSVTTPWDNKFIISISNRKVKDWPTVSANGTNMVKALKDDKWHVYLDLNKTVGGDGAAAVLGKESVTLHFEMKLEGEDRSVVLEDISFADEIPDEAKEPTITGVADGESYLLADKITPVFDFGTATISQNGGEAKAFVSGTEITETGLYILTVTNGANVKSINFRITAQALEDPDVFEMFISGWTHGGGDGSVTYNENGALLTMVSNDSKITKDVTFNTEGKTAIELTVSSLNAGWDAGMRLYVFHEKVAGWPGISYTGGEILRVQSGDKWKIYFDLTKINSDILDKESVTLRFEFTLRYGANKSMVFESMKTVEKLPDEFLAITGVTDGAVYELGTNAIKPEFNMGTAIISKNGAEAEIFASGTEITEAGLYLLSVTSGEVTKTAKFKVFAQGEGGDVFEAFISGWTHSGDEGALVYNSDGARLTTASATDNKISKGITLNTVGKTAIELTVSGVTAGWDGGMYYYVGNRNVAGWPNINFTGGNVLKMQSGNKWKIYFDLTKINSDILDKDRVTLTFEFVLRYGAGKAMTFESMKTIAELPAELTDSDVIDSFSVPNWNNEVGEAQITFADGKMTFKTPTSANFKIFTQKTFSTVGRKYIRFDMTANGSCWDGNFVMEIVDNVTWQGSVKATGANCKKIDKPDGNGWYIYLELPDALCEKESISLAFKLSISGWQNKYVTLDEIRFVDELPAELLPETPEE